uniref:Uncharacterized protein n=1 Tax=Tetranychus urticae TaxID=32264 RepID=T1JWE0_TETUR
MATKLFQVTKGLELKQTPVLVQLDNYLRHIEVLKRKCDEFLKKSQAWNFDLSKLQSIIRRTTKGEDEAENDHKGKKLFTLSNEHKGEIEARVESFNAADEPENMLMLTSFCVAGTQTIQMFNRDANHNYDKVRDKLITRSNEKNSFLSYGNTSEWIETNWITVSDEVRQKLIIFSNENNSFLQSWKIDKFRRSDSWI